VGVGRGGEREGEDTGKGIDAGGGEGVVDRAGASDVGMGVGDGIAGVVVVDGSVERWIADTDAPGLFPAFVPSGEGCR